jgi:hypothetical protein
MKTKVITGLAFFIAILSSCQKEFSFDGANPSANLIDGSYINKIYYDTLNIATNKYDTITSVNFFYDNLKRVTSVKFIDEIQNSLFQEFQFFYTNNDTLPFKSVETISLLVPMITTTYHFFNAQGQKQMDSVLYYNGDTIIRHYTYLPGKMVCMNVQRPQFSAVDTFQIDTAKIDTRGNVINYIRYSHDTNNPNNPLLIFTYEVNNTYDNNVNPLYTISCTKASNPLTNYYGGNILDRTSPNNLVTTQEIYYTLNTYTYNTLFFYTYKPNGLVEKMTETYDNTPGHDRALFSYIHL